MVENNCDICKEDYIDKIEKKRAYMREYMKKRRQDPVKNEEMKARVRMYCKKRWLESEEYREKNRLYCAIHYQKVKEILKNVKDNQ